MTYSDDQRFWAKTLWHPYDCWVWQGGRTGRGYGEMLYEGRIWLAHRWAYERFVGPIPKGFTIDHLCHAWDRCRAGENCLHRRCVNPSHLEAVTNADNHARMPAAVATHCKRGHPFDEANTMILTAGNGRRKCRKCVNMKRREWYRSRKADAG